MQSSESGGCFVEDCCGALTVVGGGGLSLQNQAVGLWKTVVGAECRLQKQTSRFIEDDCASGVIEDDSFWLSPWKQVSNSEEGTVIMSPPPCRQTLVAASLRAEETE